MSLTKVQATALRSRALEQTKGNNTSSFKLGEVLYLTRTQKIKGSKTGLWGNWKFASWELYLEKELQLSWRHAIRLVRIWKKFGVDLKGSWPIKDVLPIEKMEALVPVVTKKNVRAWLKRARNLNTYEIRQLVQKPFVKGISNLRRFVAVVTDVQLGDIRYAIELAKDFYKVRERGPALAFICRDWVAKVYK